ncbi:hypothetical protein ACTA71_011513 [Dictyostelium dimigraforme]
MCDYHDDNDEENISDYELGDQEYSGDDEDIKESFTEEEKNQLYFDENEDDENEKWMKDNYKLSGKFKSDGRLSCPCCFTLLCIECQQHSTYSNQYRAIQVKNCTISNDIITYNDKKEKNITNRINNNNKKKKKKKKKNNNYQKYRNNVNKGDPQQVEVKLENTHIDDDDNDDNDEDEEDNNKDEEYEEYEENDNNSEESLEDEDECYRAVNCSICNTHVAMYDNNEIYHFFDVFPS